MDLKKKYLENILKYLKLGDIDGLEELYLECKLETGTITKEQLKTIINHIEKKYKVKYKTALSHFPADSLKTLKISQIIQVLTDLTLEKLEKIDTKAGNLLNEEADLVSPYTDQVKLRTIEFWNISFNDFIYRIDLFSDWILDKLSKSPVKQIIRLLLNKCKIQCSEDEFKSFSKELKKIFSANYEFSLPDFRALTFAWYESCHSTEDLRSKLLRTINEFEELRSQKLADQEKSSINDLLINLKSKLKELPSYEVREENFENRCIEGIAHIFKFYSKQQFLIGKTPTFESIKSNTEVLNMGKFIQFCKDFQILTQDSKEKTMTQFLRQVFIQTAEFSRSMSENHFLLALEKISERFFDKNFDKKNNTKWSQLPVEDKRIKLFEYLNFHRPEIYSAKLKGLIPHFGVEQNDRIPDYDLAKNYKVKPEKIKLAKLQVEEWKKKKMIEKSMNKLPKTERVERKGYAGRFEKIKRFKEVGGTVNEFDDRFY